MRVLFNRDNNNYVLKSYNKDDKGLMNYIERVAPRIGVNVKWVLSDNEEIRVDKEFINLQDIADVLLGL